MFYSMCAEVQNWVHKKLKVSAPQATSLFEHNFSPRLQSQIFQCQILSEIFNGSDERYTIVATPIERRRSIKSQSFHGGAIFKFCPFLPSKRAFESKKVAFCSRWHSNQEWRSIGADTVCITLKLRFLKISDSDPYFVEFQTMQIFDLQTMLYHPAKVLSPSSKLLLDSSWLYCVNISQVY